MQANTSQKAPAVPVKIDKERELVIPDAVLAEHLSPEEIRILRLSGAKVLSITLRASKG